MWQTNNEEKEGDKLQTELGTSVKSGWSYLKKQKSLRLPVEVVNGQNLPPSQVTPAKNRRRESSFSCLHISLRIKLINQIL